MLLLFQSYVRGGQRIDSGRDRFRDEDVDGDDEEVLPTTLAVIVEVAAAAVVATVSSSLLLLELVVVVVVLLLLVVLWMLERRRLIDSLMRLPSTLLMVVPVGKNTGRKPMHIVVASCLVCFCVWFWLLRRTLLVCYLDDDVDCCSNSNPQAMCRRKFSRRKGERRKSFTCKWTGVCLVLLANDDDTTLQYCDARPDLVSLFLSSAFMIKQCFVCQVCSRFNRGSSMNA